MGTKQGRAAETEKPGKYAKFIKGYTAEEIDRSGCWSVNDTEQWKPRSWAVV